MQRSTLAKRAWLVLFIAISIFYLWGLGTFPFVGPDEPRYAQVAREMFARRDLITPTLGGLPWFEKPPLLYWLMMIGYRVLGINEYAARLGPALCGLVTACFLWWIGRNIERDELQSSLFDLGGWAALIWLSSTGAIGFSRAASFDIVLTMTITGAFAFFLAAEVRGGNRNPRVYLLRAAFYVLVGLSFLAKGLIGFIIIFGVIGLYYLVRRERPSATFAKSLLWGIPVAVIIAGTWFVPMVFRHGRVFLDQFIIQHHFARFVSNKYHHPAPIYFYLPVLIGMSLPWSVVFGAATVSARRWNWRGPTSLDRLKVFAALWLILPVVFFSLSGSKLVAYILPVLPAIALLAGERIVCALNAGRGQRLLQLSGALLFVLGVGGHWYAATHLDISLTCLNFMAMPLLVAGLVTALLAARIRPYLFALIAVAAITASATALKCAAPRVAQTDSVRDLLRAADKRGYGNVPVTQLHVIERAAEFYAAGRITYGSDGEPVKFESVLQVAEAARRSKSAVLCFVPVEWQMQLLSFAGAKSELIASNGSVALMAVQPPVER